MSLYRKYRPQSFAHLVGQDHVKETLMNELKHGHLTHAYLFAGPRGTGKTSTARLIAKSLNCTARDESGEPCETCEFCLSITEGSLIDVIEIDAASNRGIDEIRDLREKIKFAPTRATSKTYIIDEVHMLTKEAFNALLKTLEEPPPNVYFILATTEVHKIPETIISRCQRFDFKRIDIKTIMTRLNFIAQAEQIQAEDLAIELIARNVQGGLRDAISLFEQMVFEGKLTAAHIKEHLGIAGHETVSRLVEALLLNDADKALRIIQETHNEGYDLAAFQREILEYLRETMMESVSKDKPVEVKTFLGMIEIFLDSRDIMKNSPIPQLPLEMACLKICLGMSKPAVITTASPAAQTTAPAPVSTSAPSPTAAPEAAKDGFFKQLFKDKNEEAEATKAEISTAEHMKASIEERSWDLETLKNQWPRIIEELQPPSLRRSLGTARISGFTEDSVELTFASKFHMEKIKLIENRSKLEAAFGKFFGKLPKMTFEYETVALEEIPQSKGSLKPDGKKMGMGKISPGGAKTGTPATVENLAEKALDIFGGEEI